MQEYVVEEFQASFHFVSAFFMAEASRNSQSHPRSKSTPKHQIREFPCPCVVVIQIFIDFGCLHVVCLGIPIVGNVKDSRQIPQNAVTLCEVKVPVEDSRYLFIRVDLLKLVLEVLKLGYVFTSPLLILVSTISCGILLILQNTIMALDGWEAWSTKSFNGADII